MASLAIEELFEAATYALGKGLLTCRRMTATHGGMHKDGRGQLWTSDECPACRLEAAVDNSREEICGDEDDGNRLDNEIDVMKEEAR
jgi:hypothetical protein